MANAGCNLPRIHPNKEARHAQELGAAGADLPPRLVRSTSWCQEVLKARLEQPGLLGGVSAHVRGSGMRWVLKFFPTQVIP